MDGPQFALRKRRILHIALDHLRDDPVVLDAIKAELHLRTGPGRFVLTGSAQHQALPHSSQALVGRLDRLQVFPLSQGETDGVREKGLEQLFDNADTLLTPQRPQAPQLRVPLGPRSRTRLDQHGATGPSRTGLGITNPRKDKGPGSTAPIPHRHHRDLQAQPVAAGRIPTNTDTRT